MTTIGNGGENTTEKPERWWEYDAPEVAWWDQDIDLTDYESVITLYDADSNEIGSNTKEDWMQELLEPKEVLLVTYGYSNLDIINALIEIGEFGEQYDPENEYHDPFGDNSHEYDGNG